MKWWENRFLRIRAEKLYLGGREAADWAGRYGTPLFLYSRKQVLANFERLGSMLPRPEGLKTRVCYAMKANPHEEILRLLKRKGAWIDAVSPGEVDAAMAAGFPPERILFTGTSLSREDLARVFALDGVTVNIDALEQIDLMREVREKKFSKKTIRVSVRWNPGIGRGFNSKVITAGSRTPDGTPIKFGIEDSKVARAFRKAGESGFRPVGLHQHLGSGWVREDFLMVRTAVSRMLRKAAELERLGFGLEFIDFGGGFGPRYSRKQHPFPVRRYLEFIGRAIRKSGLKAGTIAFEPGKFLVGDAGVLLLRVEYLKKSYGNIFACVNGGTFNTVPRPAIYTQAYHEIVNCSRAGDSPGKRITVAGNLCETGDVFGKEVVIPRPRPGDFLAVLCAGAYCRSMASNFNLRPIPPEIVID
jgi:diaminopimelate decarboxylase